MNKGDKKNLLSELHSIVNSLEKKNIHERDENDFIGNLNRTLKSHGYSDDDSKVFLEKNNICKKDHLCDYIGPLQNAIRSIEKDNQPSQPNEAFTQREIQKTYASFVNSRPFYI